MRGCKSHISKVSLLSILSFLLPATHHLYRHHFKAAVSLPWGFSWVFGCLFSGRYATLSLLRHFQAWERELVAQVSLLLVWLALTSHLPWNLVSFRHPAQVWLQLNPSQPHPGFQWHHRPGFGFPFPLWASGPQLSLVSDFISSLIVDNSKHPSSICGWHRTYTSARGCCHWIWMPEGEGTGCWTRCSAAWGREE